MTKRNKILVTGGLGYIGSHTVVELIQSGFDVTILDDLSNAEHMVLDRIEQITGVRAAFHQVNMLDKEKLQSVFALASGFDAVIHFAAFKAVGESVQEPIKYFYNNLVSLLHLLEIMEQYPAGKLVFSSSATVYGDPRVLPVTEREPFQKALSAYGSTKQVGEDIIEKVTAVKQVKAISLRYFNPVGAHASALIGELPKGVPNNLMPYLTQVAAGLRKELTVFGNDYPTPDGTCIRDYIHVVDLAKAHVKSCERLLSEESEAYEVYNIGTGNGLSVMELIKAFEQYNNLKLNYRIGARRPGDSPATYADVSKATWQLQWKATLGVEAMVTSAWKWQQSVS